MLEWQYNSNNLYNLKWFRIIQFIKLGYNLFKLLYNCCAVHFGDYFLSLQLQESWMNNLFPRKIRGGYQFKWNLKMKGLMGREKN